MTTPPLYRLPDDLVLDRRDKVEQALRKLAPMHRRILTLRFFGHLTSKQIATALSCSVASVQVLQHQALIELQRLIV
jgi:RNA polymerase sigma factor (sigma-70 family)